MILPVSMKDQSVSIDLTGPHGNAEYLIGCAVRWSKRLELDAEEIVKDMKSSDYEHLLSVLEEHFGDYVIFYVEDENHD